MKIFITGGTGFLGKRVAARLAQAGHEVRALARPSSPRQSFPSGITVTPGDVTDIDSLVKGATGCDAVVHSAALVKMWVRDRGEFDRINVGGLRNILEASRRTGVKRILYTSSFIALGPTDGRVADETQVHSPTGHHNDYERTKAAADVVAREAAATGAPLVIVYPGVVYGAGEMTDGSLMTRTVLDFMNRHVPGFMGSGDQRICYAVIDDVVEGHLLALERAAPGSRIILPASSITQNGMCRVGAEPLITDEVVRIYRHDWAYRSDRAVSELGYRITPLEEGLRRTVEWLRSARP